MPAARSIEEIQALLSLQRQSLHVALQLQAAGVPVDWSQMIDTPRQRIQQLKAIVRQQGGDVDDLPEEERDRVQEPALVQPDSSPSVTPTDLPRLIQIASTIPDEVFLHLLDEHQHLREAQNQLDDLRIARVDMPLEIKTRVMTLWEQMLAQSRTLNALYVAVIREKLTRTED